MQPSGGCNPRRSAHPRLRRRGALHSHERAIARLEQKIRVYKGSEQLRAPRGIQSPQPSRLRFREPQPGHFEELPLYSPEHFVREMSLRRHTVPFPNRCAPGINWELTRRFEQRMCQRLKARPGTRRSVLLLKMSGNRASCRLGRTHSRIGAGRTPDRSRTVGVGNSIRGDPAPRCPGTCIAIAHDELERLPVSAFA